MIPAPQAIGCDNGEIITFSKLNDLIYNLTDWSSVQHIDRAYLYKINDRVYRLYHNLVYFSRNTSFYFTSIVLIENIHQELISEYG